MKNHDELRNEFYQASKPLIDFLNKYYHPHTHVIVSQTTTELLIGEMAVVISDGKPNLEEEKENESSNFNWKYHKRP